MNPGHWKIFRSASKNGPATYGLTVALRVIESIACVSSAAKSGAARRCTFYARPAIEPLWAVIAPRHSRHSSSAPMFFSISYILFAVILWTSPTTISSQRHDLSPGPLHRYFLEQNRVHGFPSWHITHPYPENPLGQIPSCGTKIALSTGSPLPISEERNIKTAENTNIVKKLFIMITVGWSVSDYRRDGWGGSLRIWRTSVRDVFREKSKFKMSKGVARYLCWWYLRFRRSVRFRTASFHFYRHPTSHHFFELSPKSSSSLDLWELLEEKSREKVQFCSSLS